MKSFFNKEASQGAVEADNRLSNRRKVIGFVAGMIATLVGVVGANVSETEPVNAGNVECDAQHDTLCKPTESTVPMTKPEVTTTTGPGTTTTTEAGTTTTTEAGTTTTEAHRQPATPANPEIVLETS